MADEIKKGDIVTLKSGGPEMTVNGVDYEGDWICVWFDSANLPHRDNFNNAALTKSQE